MLSKEPKTLTGEIMCTASIFPTPQGEHEVPTSASFAERITLRHPAAVELNYEHLLESQYSDEYFNTLISRFSSFTSHYSGKKEDPRGISRYAHEAPMQMLEETRSASCAVSGPEWRNETEHLAELQHQPPCSPGSKGKQITSTFINEYVWFLSNRRLPTLELWCKHVGSSVAALHQALADLTALNIGERRKKSLQRLLCSDVTQIYFSQTESSACRTSQVLVMHQSDTFLFKRLQQGSLLPSLMDWGIVDTTGQMDQSVDRWREEWMENRCTITNRSIDGRIGTCICIPPASRRYNQQLF